MSEAHAAPDVVYSGRRGAWVAIILLVLLNGGMAIACSPVWAVMSEDDDWTSSDRLPFILVALAVQAGGFFCLILAIWRAWRGRPRLILSGKALTYQGLFRTARTSWSELGTFLILTKRQQVSDDSGIGPSTRVLETSKLVAPIPGKRELWPFWRPKQFRIPDAFDTPLAEIQAALNRRVRAPRTRGSAMRA
ncbi:MAG TPA: hypothetical protein VKS60_13535 [Stellaceae bacterium]|nr:hypothetical protein [Stellaceae bacterium]